VKNACRIDFDLPLNLTFLYGKQKHWLIFEIGFRSSQFLYAALVKVKEVMLE